MQSIRRSTILSAITLILIIGTKTSKAQNVNWGVTGGLTISSHTNDFWFIEDDIELQFKPNVALGYKVGLLGRIDMSRNIRVQFEPSLTMLGAAYDDTFTLRGTEFKTDSRTQLTYAHLPVLLQLTTGHSQENVYGRKRSLTTFHISVGPFGGYLIDARFEGTNSGAPIGIEFEGEFSNDIVSQYNDFDAGAMFGLGFESGHYKKVGFETRAQYSVTNSGSSDLDSFKPHNIGLTFALYFVF